VHSFKKEKEIFSKPGASTEPTTATVVVSPLVTLFVTGRDPLSFQQ
jgi:hypothetical protein